MRGTEEIKIATAVEKMKKRGVERWKNYYNVIVDKEKGVILEWEYFTIMTQTLYKTIKGKAVLIFVWITFSLITGFSMAEIVTTGGNLEQFYNRGDFFPIYLDGLVKNGQNVSYEAEEDKFTVTAEGAAFQFNSGSQENGWKYLRVNLLHLNIENLKVQLLYYDRSGNIVGEDFFSMEAGEHVYDITAEAFSGAVMVVNEPVGTTFSISAFEFSTEPSEKNRAFPMAAFLGTLLSLGFTALLFYIAGKKKRHIEWYRFVDGLQAGYMEAGNRIFQLWKPFPDKVQSVIRIGIMILMFVVLSFVNVYNFFFDETWHPFVTLFLMVCILLLAFFYMEKPLQKRDWRNLLAASWVVLWLMSCVSDFSVTKKSPYYGFYGYLMMFIVGFLFFVWSNLEKRERILWEICKALEGTYFLCVLYCLVFRPHIDGYRYKGFYNNPNPFGLYLAVVTCAFLCELNRYIKMGKCKAAYLGLHVSGLASAVFFLIKSQCTTGVLAFGCVCFLWGIGNLFAKPREERKRFFQTIVLLVICYLPVSLILQWGIINLPGMLHTQIVYPDDADFAWVQEYELPIGTVTVHAAENEESGVPADSAGHMLDKIFNSNSINGLLSGRLYHYKTYLRDMNLLGHEKRAVVYGSSINSPHNGFLSYAHMYGVYILIPYALMFISYFVRAFRYQKRMAKATCFSFFPMAVCIVFFLENMMDNVDTPFHWIVWFIFVFAGGFLFQPDESNA